MDHSQLLYYVDLFGTAVFALSGVLIAVRKNMDFIGVVILASAVAVGGGTVRDLLLNVETIFWVRDNTYLYIVFATCLFSVISLQFLGRVDTWKALAISDAIGISVFVVIGLTKSLAYGTSDMVAIIFGTMTAIGGGIIRDTLAGEIPFVLRKEIYATACILGGISYVITDHMHFPQTISILVSISVTFTIRIISVIYSLRLPTLKF